MIKRIITTCLVTCSAIIVNAQLPQWVITPDYDSIGIKVDGAIIETKRGGETRLWDMGGSLLYKTEHIVFPFKDGVATIISKDDNSIIGLIDVNGKFISLPNLQVAYGNPYYEDGLLLGYDDKDGYSYYNKKGEKVKFGQSVRPYPFHHGFAPYFTFDNIEKKKDPYYGYYKSNGEPVKYKIQVNGTIKYIDPKTIEFVSGINSEHKGVCVIKGKLYWFDAGTETFEPMLWGEDNNDKKRHLTMSGEYENYLIHLPNDTISINARYCKNQFANLLFTPELVPVIFNFDGDEHVFEETAIERMTYSTKLSDFNEDGKLGLIYNGDEVLPVQFDQVGLKYDNKAFVCLNGKWGVIEIVPDIHYSLKLNKGEDIAFLHQKFETQIRLDLPAQISAKEARIDIPRETGCLIDKTSRVTKDTESGNYVTYDCVLNIPQALPDTVTNITYSPVRVSYDGIALFDVPIVVKAWHYKYYNVDPIDSETSITDGVASITFDVVSAQRSVGEGYYPFEIRIEADSISVQYEKISETRYKCLVSNLQEGNNNLNIYVTEKGCPSSVFPFEIFYTKPVPKKKTKEEVVIRKKSPASKAAARLEI